jgi:hypothetical protein
MVLVISCSDAPCDEVATLLKWPLAAACFHTMETAHRHLEIIQDNALCSEPKVAHDMNL